MAKELINIGTNANDGTGDALRTAFAKINNNFSTLYSSTMPTGPQGSVQYRATVNLSDLAYNGTQYVAVAAPNRILVSTDATNWTQVTNPTTKTPRAITVVNSKFVIVGDNGLVMTSTDGTTWTAVTTTITSNLVSVAYDKNNSVLIAVGANSAIVRSTDSAATWSTISAPLTCTLNAVTWAETLDLFVAVGESGVILNSTTGGTTWNQMISGVTTNLNAVSAYLNDVIVVGDAGKILTSPNTILWTQQTSGVTTNLNGVTAGIIGTTVTGVAVGDGGKIVTSAYDTTFSFNAWNATSYPSTTTVDLYSAKTVNSAIYAMGSTGTLLNVVGTTWIDCGATAGIEGNADLTFDPYLNLLSIDADIIPQTSNVWKLGNTTNRWESANFSANGITIGTVTQQQTPTLTIEFRDSANLANLANIKVDTATASNVFTDVLDANIANIDTANIGNLTSANANIGNLTVANLTLTSLTITDLSIPGNISAANAVFTGTVTANYFIGDGSNLSNITGANVIGNVTSAITANFANYAGNVTVAAQPNITSVGTLTSLDVAGKVTAAYLQGDGGNITGLPVQSIVAGANVTVTNVGGVWTISAGAGGGGGGGGGGATPSNPSHLPLNSIQIAGPSGTFNSSSALQFDPSVNHVNLTGNMTAYNFNGNVIGGNGAFNLVTAGEVIAPTFTGNLRGNVIGNIAGNTAVFTGNLTAGNIAANNISFNTQTSISANIGNIHISRSNIHEFGAGNDNFVIDTERSNLVIQGANVATLGVNAPFVLIKGGNVAGNARGGNVTIESGDGGSAGKAGTLTLKGGAGGAGNDGGNIDILGGNGGLGGDGGTIRVIAGVTNADTVSIKGANLYLQAGNTINEDAGTLILQGGNATGAVLNGGNITITPGVGSQANGHVYIANIRWPSDAGLNNQVLTTDGSGIAYWETVNGSIPGSITVSNIVNGTSNVEISTPGAPVKVSVAGVSNVATFTSSGLETTSVKTNHVILGNSSFTASDTWWVDAQTSTTAPLQVLFEMPAAGQNSVDFKVIAYDVPASNKQSSMITSVTYGISTNYSVYATTMINTMIASYTVDQSGGNIRLLASPSVNYLVRYTVIITKY